MGEVTLKGAEHVHTELEFAVRTLAAIAHIDWRKEGRVVFKLTGPMGLMDGATWEDPNYAESRLDEIAVSIPYAVEDEEPFHGRCRLELRHALERRRLSIVELAEAMDADELAAKLESVDRYLRSHFLTSPGGMPERGGKSVA